MKSAFIRYGLYFSLLLLATAHSLAARDLYLLQGFTTGATFDQQVTVWSTDALFYNKGPLDAKVTLISISNGIDPANRVGQSFTIQAGKTASLANSVRWVPAIPFVMLHLDVPADVVVNDILYIGGREAGALVSPNTLYRRFGVARLPIFDTLAQPGEQQVHLESNIGDIPAHVNVGIYNAGSVVANVRIETRASCDDGIVSVQTVNVAADTVIQVGPFQAQNSRCTQGEQANSIYTIVTADQPTLTFVSALANDNTPTTSITVNGDK
jgi:hypothetical protein